MAHLTSLKINHLSRRFVFSYDLISLALYLIFCYIDDKLVQNLSQIEPLI